MQLRFLALLLLATTSVALAMPTTGELPEQPGADIGYPTPDAALRVLRAKPGVSIREENDWYVVSDKKAGTLWSITKPGHPAHPSAVKRTFTERDRALYLDMKVMCGGSKQACDDLVRQFQQINADLTEKINRKRP